MAASSSSAARGIRIVDGAEEEEAKARKPSWVSLGFDCGDEAGPQEALERARGCDVFIGHGGGAKRVVSWLRAELELLGVPCASRDRRRCADAPSHAAARAAMDMAAAGVVVVTPASLANPYAVEEIRAFAARGALVPVLLGLARADLAAAADIVDRRGEVWARHGGHLWKEYDGDERDWREAVEGLARAEPAVVFGDDGDVRDRVLDVLDALGARLGRRAVVAAVSRWRAAAEQDPELPFPRNAGFVGRAKELADVAALLRGGPTRAYSKALKQAARDEELMGQLTIDQDLGPFVSGAVCVSGPSGAGKTELVLEFAHRYSRQYKRVLWVHGEPRFLRLSYLRLADHLGVAVGDDPAAASGPRSLPEIEGDAIAKIRKELARDVPYLVIIDNLESEKDWWDGRAIPDLLPPRTASDNPTTHVIITSRLRDVQGVRTLRLGNLARPETMRLMKGTRAFGVADTAVLRRVEDDVGGMALGVALVGAVLSEVDVGPGELHLAMSAAPHRAPTWAARDDPALRDHPGLVRLLDASLALLDREATGLGAAVARLLEASSFFAPAPIPVATLARAAGCSGSGTAAEKPSSRWKRFVRRSLSCASPSAAASGHAELEALVRLGLARPCARPGHVSVHAVFRLFSRRIGSGHAGRAVVRAVATSSAAAPDEHHAWAACLALFRFEAPAAAVELPPHELARFAARLALPLAARAVATCSAYAAALELLREATAAVRAAEDRYSVSPRRRGTAAGSRTGGADWDPRDYEELARARAELLKARARMMVRAGQYAIAEDHCFTAIDILEVVCGKAHPETQAVRDYMEQAVTPHRS